MLFRRSSILSWILISFTVVFYQYAGFYFDAPVDAASPDRTQPENQTKSKGQFRESAGNSILNPLRSTEEHVVVVDPGHGGRDRGVEGIGGVLEKNVALDFARALQLSMESRGFEVYLTRNSDEFISLKTRSQVANQKDADLFVSIHANTSRDTGRNGLGMGALSVSIPKHKWSESSKSALETLQYEGYSDEELRDMDWVPEQIRGSRFTSESLRYISNLRNCFKSDELKLDKRFLTEAPFAVLKDARMPAFLLEVGFLSSQSDVKLLTRSRSRKNLADSISNCMVGLTFK